MTHGDTEAKPDKPFVGDVIVHLDVPVRLSFDEHDSTPESIVKDIAARVALDIVEKLFKRAAPDWRRRSVGDIRVAEDRETTIEPEDSL